MKVSDFQKYLRTVADLIATKTPAKELTEAADALEPFGTYTMADFGKFLKAVEAKYGEAKALPDLTAKQSPAPRAARAATPREPELKAADLIAAVNDVKVRVRTDGTITKEQVATELKKFAGMKKPEVESAVQALGLKAKFRNREAAVAALVNLAIGAQAGVERSDV
jgi:hypothetical protein